MNLIEQGINLIGLENMMIFCSTWADTYFPPYEAKVRLTYSDFRGKVGVMKVDENQIELELEDGNHSVYKLNNSEKITFNRISYFENHKYNPLTRRL